MGQTYDLPQERSNMTYKFTIKGTLPNLNDYIKALNSNRHKGNALKQGTEDIIIWQAKPQLRGIHIKGLVLIKYDFYEPNKKRDLDNVSSFARKTIQDSLVKMGVLENDGWKNILGSSEQFYCDRENPRIEVTIMEAGD